MIFVLALFLLTIVITITMYFRHRKLNMFHLHAEYWVYSTNTSLPNQDRMMTRMVGDNPYIQKGQNPVGAAEGLLFSDIRLKIALVLRAKNPNLFLADKLPETIPDHHEFVQDINKFQSITKLQFASPTKMKDKRHLQFLIHLADAVAEVEEANWIYDKVSGQLYDRAQLQAILRENFNATKAEIHVRLTEDGDYTFRSFGLPKIGIPDFETLPVPHDQTSLIREVLEKFITLSWERGEAFPDAIQAYGDEFYLVQKRITPNLTQMRIIRKQLLN